MTKTLGRFTAMLLSAAVLVAALPAAAFAATPTAVSFTTSVRANGQNLIQLQGADADETALTYATLSAPAHGTLSNLNATTGYVIYTPASGYTGADSFTYKVTSGGEDSSAATVTLNVTGALTTVTGAILDPSGQPRKGVITFVLTQKVTTSAGVVPVGASVAAQLNAAGGFTVQLFPSRGMSPRSYYQVKFKDTAGAREENLGLYDFPASATPVSFSAYEVIGTALGQGHTFVTESGVEALTQAVANATLAQLLTVPHTANRVQKWDGSGLADTIISDAGAGTATVNGNFTVTGATNLPSLTVTGPLVADGSALTNVVSTGVGGSSSTGSLTQAADTDEDTPGAVIETRVSGSVQSTQAKDQPLKHNFGFQGNVYPTGEQAAGNLFPCLLIYNGQNGDGIVRLFSAVSHGCANFEKEQAAALFSPQESYEGLQMHGPHAFDASPRDRFLYYDGHNGTKYQIALLRSYNGGAAYERRGVVRSESGSNHALFPFTRLNPDQSNPAKKFQHWWACGASDVTGLCYGYSPDGETWTKYGEVIANPAGAGGVVTGTVERGADGVDRVFYVVRSAAGATGYYETYRVNVTNPESTYTGGVKVMPRDPTATATLTATLSAGSKVVNVPTAGLTEGEGVIYDDTGSEPETNRIAKINSASQLTLVRAATDQYSTGAGATLRSLPRYAANHLRTILKIGDRYYGLFSVFLHYQENGHLRELMYWGYTDSLDGPWTWDHKRSIALELEAGTQDAISRENGTIVPLKHWAVPAAAEALVTFGKARRATNQSIPTGAGLTAISFSVLDAWSQFVTWDVATPTDLVITQAGVYDIHAGGFFADEADGVPTGYRLLAVSVTRGGVETFLDAGDKREPTAGNMAPALRVDAHEHLEVGDILRVKVAQTSGGALDFVGNTANSPVLSIVKQ